MHLIYAAIVWSVALILSYQFPQLQSIYWFIPAVFALVGVFLFRHNKSVRYMAIMFCIFSLGVVRLSIYPQTSEVAQFNNTGGLTVTGVIADDPDIRDDRTLFRLSAEQVQRGADIYTTSGDILVRANRYVDIAYGDRVQVTGLLFTPAEYDTFSYADYLARDGIYSVMRDTAVEVLSSNHGLAFYSAVFSLRHQSLELIGKNLPEPQAGLLSGILIGNERGISPELQDDFSRVGAAHVIAISGFNMVLLAGLITALFNHVMPNRLLSAVLSILIIALYTIFVGANPAVVRAAIMSSLLIVGDALRRKSYVPASLAFALFVMSVHNPMVLWDISFQLSFFATLGLALFADPLQNQFEAGLNRVLPDTYTRNVMQFISEPVVVTLASLVLTLPLILVYFNRLSLVILPVNLLIVPVQSFILILGGLALFTTFIVPVVGQILFWMTMVFLAWTIGIVRVFADLPFADVEFSMNSQLVLLFIVLVIGWGIMQATRPLWWLRLQDFVQSQVVVVSILVAEFSLLALIGSIALARPDNQLHVHFLDMGHTSATLIVTPNGGQVLIDGGRFPSRLLTAIGDRMPFNDREIDVVFITQPDEFHMGALPSVLARYQTGVILTTGQETRTAAYQELKTLLADRLVVPVTAGYTIDIDEEVMIEVLHPQEQPAFGASVDDSAMVLRVTYGEISFLLTSQASIEAQQELLEAGNYPLTTVLQLPQQATMRSLDETFLETTQAQYIVLQSDIANFRGDPDPDTMSLIGDTPVYRSDVHGAIEFITDGELLWVGTEK